jgi:hypothetical protein
LTQGSFPIRSCLVLPRCPNQPARRVVERPGVSAIGWASVPATHPEPIRVRGRSHFGSPGASLEGESSQFPLLSQDQVGEAAVAVAVEPLIGSDGSQLLDGALRANVVRMCSGARRVRRAPGRHRSLRPDTTRERHPRTESRPYRVTTEEHRHPPCRQPQTGRPHTHSVLTPELVHPSARSTEPEPLSSAIPTYCSPWALRPSAFDHWRPRQSTTPERRASAARLVAVSGEVSMLAGDG